MPSRSGGGAALSALGLPAASSIEVVSATGYRRRFPASDADALVLATHVAGRLVSAGHGVRCGWWPRAGAAAGG